MVGKSFQYVIIKYLKLQLHSRASFNNFSKQTRAKLILKQIKRNIGKAGTNRNKLQVFWT